jgi:hypothetical protein
MGIPYFAMNAWRVAALAKDFHLSFVSPLLTEAVVIS